MKMRVNQNLSWSSNLLGNVKNKSGVTPFSKNQEIIKNLLFYFSELEQTNKDVYGYIEIDLNKFCKEFGYDRTNYSKKSNRKDLMEIPVVDSNKSHAVSNVFEEALTEIIYQQIPIQQKGIRNKTDINYKFIPVIEYLSVAISEKTKKRKYFLKLHEDFKISFFRFYNLCHADLYKRLKTNHKRTKGLQDLYLRLEYHKAKLIQEYGLKERLSIQLSFEDLWKVCGIKETYAPSDKKKHIVSKVKKIKAEAEKLKEEQELKKKSNPNTEVYSFNIELTWNKTAESKWSFVPIIHFIFTAKDRSVLKRDRLKDKLLFQSLFNEKLTAKYANFSEKYSIKNWIENDNVASELKAELYRELYLKTYNTECSEEYIKGRFLRQNKKQIK